MSHSSQRLRCWAALQVHLLELANTLHSPLCSSMFKSGFRVCTCVFLKINLGSCTYYANTLPWAIFPALFLLFILRKFYFKFPEWPQPHSVAQAIHKLGIPLPQPPRYWYSKFVSPDIASKAFHLFFFPNKFSYLFLCIHSGTKKYNEIIKKIIISWYLEGTVWKFFHGNKDNRFPKSYAKGFQVIITKIILELTLQFYSENFKT